VLFRFGMSLEIVARGWVLVVALVVAVAVGLWRQRRSGRARTVDGSVALTAADLDAPLGVRATLVQFSSAVCSPCRSTRQVLRELTDHLPGVVHVEVDAAERIELTRRFDVVRTPTVLVLDATGRVVRRASGGLTPSQARAAVLDVVPAA
jgi:thiol-disulfide isomerase/thioredoxin